MAAARRRPATAGRLPPWLHHWFALAQRSSLRGIRICRGPRRERAAPARVIECAATDTMDPNTARLDRPCAQIQSENTANASAQTLHSSHGSPLPAGYSAHRSALSWTSHKYLCSFGTASNELAFVRPTDLSRHGDTIFRDRARRECCSTIRWPR